MLTPLLFQVGKKEYIMSDLRHVYGNINADGTIKSGSGDFTVVQEGNGEYTIVFTQAFANMPTVVTTQNYKDWDDFTYNGGSTYDNTVIIAISNSKFKMQAGGGSGSKTERNWTFIAVGV